MNSIGVNDMNANIKTKTKAKVESLDNVAYEEFTKVTMFSIVSLCVASGIFGFSSIASAVVQYGLVDLVKSFVTALI